MNSSRISEGDKVRIRSEKATASKGVAGKTGIVHGHTTPSVTGVEVIGPGRGCTLRVTQITFYGGGPAAPVSFSYITPRLLHPTATPPSHALRKRDRA